MYDDDEKGVGAILYASFDAKIGVGGQTQPFAATPNTQITEEA